MRGPGLAVLRKRGEKKKTNQKKFLKTKIG